MSPQTKSRSIPVSFQGDGDGEASKGLRARVDFLDRQLKDAVSHRDSLAMETSVLKQQVDTLEPEISRIRAELQQAQQEIERLKTVTDPRNGADSATPDEILAFISERNNPSIRRIVSRFGLSRDEAGATLGELQRSGLASPLNLQNGVQRWIVTKKGSQYLEGRGLVSKAFRQRSPSRFYW